MQLSYTRLLNFIHTWTYYVLELAVKHHACITDTAVVLARPEPGPGRDSKQLQPKNRHARVDDTFFTSQVESARGNRQEKYGMETSQGVNEVEGF